MSKERPDLSVIVAIVSDTSAARASVSLLRESLTRLTAGQDDAPAMEIIVPYLNHVDGVAAIEKEFPAVRFLKVDALDMSGYTGGGREHHDVIRAHGMRAATGRIIALLEDCALPDPGWARAVVKAHDENDYAGVGGAIENVVDRSLNWSVYFCDFGKYQNPIERGPSPFASDANTSYKTDDLYAIKDVWWDSFREVIVNAAFREKGRDVALEPAMLVNQNRKDLTFGDAVKERFVWGQSYAATRNKTLTLPKRLFYALLTPILPFILFLRLMQTARARQKFSGQFMRAAPMTLLLLFVWSLGEGVGYLIGIKDA